jgi:hypothetical protein
MLTVYVISAKIQHMYDTETYFEVIGVAASESAATKLENLAHARQEVVDVECELMEVLV